MITKEQALEHLSQVYEYCLTLPGGVNHVMSREMAVWLQRHWAQSGVNAANEKRRAKNTESRKPAQPSESGGLKNFVHPKSQAARMGERTAPPSNAVEVALPPAEVEQVEADQKRRGRIERQNPVAADDGGQVIPLSDTDLKTVGVMKPRAILSEFGEKRITAALLNNFNVPEDELPESGAQRAAMLKQMVNSVK